jgi:hypothetical protein
MKMRIFLLAACCLLLATLTTGCDAFVRKFTRKPKKKAEAKEELVLVPEEYKQQAVDKDELYRKYFLFWQSWQDELINSLFEGGSRKKQLDCIIEAGRNLSELRLLLKESAQQKLDTYINELNELKGLIEKDIYGSNRAGYLQAAERIKRNILREFSYNKVKDSLI